MSSLGEIFVTISAVNDASPIFQAVASDVASMNANVASAAGEVASQASASFNQVGVAASEMAAQISSPIPAPVIAPIDVSSFNNAKVAFGEVGVSAAEMGTSVEASASSFDDLGTQAEATTVKLTTVARGISSVSSLGLGITTLGVDFGVLDAQQTKYVRDALAVVTVVSEVARMMNYATLFTQGHTASVTINSAAQTANAASTVAATGATEGQAAAVALDTSTETASASANIALSIAQGIKTAATWIAVTAENALNISQATFLALTGVGIAVIIAAAAAVAYFANQMNNAASSVQNFNSSAAATPGVMSDIQSAGTAGLLRRGIE